MTETYEGWIALNISMPAGVAEEGEELDIASAILFELGAAGLETKMEGDQVKLIVSFAAGTDPEEIAGDVREAFEANNIPFASMSHERYAPIDWSSHWKQHFHPIAFGAADDPKQLWIVPTWIKPPEDAKNVLRIDPSSAFGTGLHATTAMCIERVAALSPIGSILDVGTGTGVLALAALMLGALRAVATDNDPEALRVAAENAERNGFTERLVLSGSDPAALGEKFDVVIANILARPLIELAPEIVAATKPGGRVVLSGITRSQIDDVGRAFRDLGLDAPITTTGDLPYIETREEWACIELEVPFSA